MRHERRLVDPHGSAQYIPQSSVIVRNFRIWRNWTQAIAADWYGVTERTWRRWEQDGAPKPVLKRIEQYAKRTGGDALRWLV